MKLTIKNSMSGHRLLPCHVLASIHPHKGMIILSSAPSHLYKTITHLIFLLLLLYPPHGKDSKPLTLKIPTQSLLLGWKVAVGV